MSKKFEAAQVVAKLLANRRTSIEEIPSLFENVERAIANLDNAAAPSRKIALRVQDETETELHLEKPRRTRMKRVTPPIDDAAADSDIPVEMDEAPLPIETIQPEPKPVLPTLVRRAEVIHVAPVTAAELFSMPAHGGVHGVVQWFDTRTGRGTLRLQGLSNDIPVEADILAGFGISRLFKGQEIEAVLEGSGDTTKITSLRLTNAPSASPLMGGTVRDRHAKQVVVELKREGPSRSAARDAAELLMPTRVRQ
jgi:cold shock CspA family protein